LNPLVSIITPVYNAEKYISSCIQSVLDQEYTDWEMILVNDCSVDNSMTNIKVFCQSDERIKLINLDTNSGAAIARNKGIEMAVGKYVAFLDVDDIWLPFKLTEQVNFLENSTFNFTFSSYNLINENGEQIGEFIIPQKVIGYHDLLKTCSIGCLTAVYNQEVLGKYYMENLKKRQDYTLWLKLLKKGNAIGIKKVLASYRVSSNSLSANKLDAAKFQWLVYRNVEKLSLIKAIYYFTHYAINGVFKY
tara:strand:+ start:7173 stop:7916 length:744 start_codon:yes stop_codon:yes gene_type:complete